MKKLLMLTTLWLVMPAVQVHAETALVPEVSPPGDIPDNQAFITFAAPAGYTIKIPEGWARKDEGPKITFADKYNLITLQVLDSSQAVDESYAKSVLVPDLQKNGRAISDVTVKTTILKSGGTVELTFDSNSEPNAVTNKQIREENEVLYFAKNGKLVAVTFTAPKGADNADQWLFMANSFRWK